jgi:F-type H+-transporting ATPase subunit delta
MSTEAIARRYARAAFELAKDEGNVAAVAKELGHFAAAYEASAELRAVEHAPSLDDKDRGEIVAEIGRRLSASDLSVRTVTMLAQRQRMAVLPDLARLVAEMTDDHLGLLRGNVRAATKLSAAYLARLKAKIEEATGKNVELTFEEDPTLIAGVVTEIGDRVVDGSVRGKLDRLAESLRQA